MSWTAGYVSDVAYTAGYFPELNPTRLPLALLNAGYAPPKVQNACELGFGQGVSIAIHAAAQPHVNWYGDDFNPSHAAFANWMVDASGAKATLTDESFAEFCARDDLPDFDFIGLHGVWSWISPENRDLIVDFLRRKLRVGGVAFISYNVLPGWASTMPLRDMLARHGDVMGSAGQSSVGKMDAALGFMDRMFQLSPAWVRANPALVDKLNELKAMPKAYLAHEYLNKNLRPMYFAEIADALSGAKLEFACSAHMIDAVEEAHLTVEQRQFLAEIENEAFRETARDYFTNAQFRRDYWIKGGRILPAAERIAQIRQLPFVLIVPRDAIPRTLTTVLGEITLQPEIYDPILDLIVDSRPRTVAQIEQALAAKGIQFLQIVQALMILIGFGAVAQAQAEPAVEQAREPARRLNETLIGHAHYTDQVGVLASPVIGGGVAVRRMEQIFIAADRAGAASHEARADHAWAALVQQDEHLVKDGETLTTSEQNHEHLVGMAKLSERRRAQRVALGLADASPPQSGPKCG